MTQDGGSPGAAPDAGRSPTDGRTAPIVESVRVLLDRIGTAALMAWTIGRELRRPRAWVDAALQQAWVMGIRSPVGRRFGLRSSFHSNILEGPMPGCERPRQGSLLALPIAGGAGR